VGRFLEKRANEAAYKDNLWLLCGAELFYAYGTQKAKSMRSFVALLSMAHTYLSPHMDTDNSVINPRTQTNAFHYDDAELTMIRHKSRYQMKGESPCSILESLGIIRREDLGVHPEVIMERSQVWGTNQPVVYSDLAQMEAAGFPAAADKYLFGEPRSLRRDLDRHPSFYGPPDPTGEYTRHVARLKAEGMLLSAFAINSMTI
jgi:hypothetical protein